MTLRLGTATADITPPPGVPMGGYGARTDSAAGTLDALTCRVVVASDEGVSLALVALDLVYVATPWATPLRARIARALGGDAAGVLIAATHTHAGPAVFRSAVVESAELRAYEDRLAALVEATAVAAATQQRPVDLALGEAPVPGVAANRRDPAAAIDTSVRVLVARSAAASCAGVIAVFGCHPTVLPSANLLYSRDLFGAAVDAAEQRLGVPVVLFNGAAGDVSTRFTRRDQSPAEVRRLGLLLGDGIVRAAATATPLASAPLAARVDDVPVDLCETPSAESAQERVATAAKQLEDGGVGEANVGERRRAAAQLEGALAQLFMATHGGAAGILGHRPRQATLQLLRLGGCDLVAVPGELLSGVGGAVRAARRRPTLLVGYANDYLGYFVPPADAARGGYEALMAFLEPASAEAIAHRLGTLDLQGQAPASGAR